MEKILCCFGSKVHQKQPEWKNFYVNLKQIVDPRCSIANEGNDTVQIKRREFQRGK